MHGKPSTKGRKLDRMHKCYCHLLGKDTDFTVLLQRAEEIAKKKILDHCKETFQTKLHLKISGLVYNDSEFSINLRQLNKTWVSACKESYTDKVS